MPKTIRPLFCCLLWAAFSAWAHARDGSAVDWWGVGDGCEPVTLQSISFERSETPISDRMADWTEATGVWLEGSLSDWSVGEWDFSMMDGVRQGRPKTVAADTAPRPKNTMPTREWRKTLTFAERNSGAFRTKKHGGVRSPGMAALCSAVVPGLGQCYNAQWYKPPVIYAGAAVIAYFIDFNLKEKRVYEKEVWARYEQDTLALNPNLTDKTKDQLLSLRNYYQQNFELTLIIAGVVYLLNIVDAVVYAHLFDFNVSGNLAVVMEPYARPNFDPGNRTFPLDMGFRLCMTFK